MWWSRLGVAVAFWVVALSTLVLSALYDLQLLRVPLNWGGPGCSLGECQVLCEGQLECNRFPPIASCFLSNLE